MDLRVLIQIILLSTLSFGQKFQCPFYEELNGCKCYPKSQSLICNEKATDFPDLSQGTYTFKTITLISTNFSKIHLNPPTIDTLILIKNPKVSILNPQIQLSNLHIAGENNLNFNEFFSQISDLITLNITGQNSIIFQELDTDIFKNLITVTKLYLKNNHITKINGTELNKYHALNEINLSNNKLKLLGKDCLLFSSDKIQVDLSHNEINLNELETSSLFKSTANLEAVYLSFNNISTLMRSTFDSLLNKSDVIFIDNNPLNCTKSGVKWVFNKAENWQRILRQARCVEINKDLFSSESIFNPPILPTTITSTSVPTVHTGPTVPTVHTGPTVPTVHTGPTVPTVHTEPTVPTVHTGPTVPTVHTGPTVPTVHTGPTVHTEPTVPTVHTGPTVPTVHTGPTVPTVHTGPTVPTVHTGPTVHIGPTVPILLHQKLFKFKLN